MATNNISNHIILLVCIAALTGCRSDSSDSYDAISVVTATFSCESGNIPLTGCWVTEQCAEAQDGDDKFLGYWIRGVHYFAQNGNVHNAHLHYNNDSCSGSPTEASIFPNFYPETYVETGTETTNEGLEGHRITYTLDTTDYQAIYIITVENKLCFSDNIVFGPNYGHYSALGPVPTIDYNECLLPISNF